ncbi:MAG: helix-turn-helix domain-containing protein [Pseudomonadota bacterium]
MSGQGVLERLEGYNWPGNIRQLENVIKRAVLVAQGGQITVDDIVLILSHEAHIGEHLEAGTAQRIEPAALPAPLTETPHPMAPPSMAMPMRGYSWVREDEAQDLLEALRRAGGNKTRAAMSLGMTPRQFIFQAQGNFKHLPRCHPVARGKDDHASRRDKTPRAQSGKAQWQSVLRRMRGVCRRRAFGELAWSARSQAVRHHGGGWTARRK